MIVLQNTDPQKTMQYFQTKKWINAQNQFTAIPFQPNSIEQNNQGFEIKSTRNIIQLSPTLNGNYIFVRNNEMLLSSVKTLSATERKFFSGLEYIFYGNKDDDYYIKLKFKKEKLPLILRW